MVVAREVVHSDVKTLGMVRVPDGRIVGGTTTALCGIDVAEAGSDACVATVLIPGVDHKYNEMRQKKIQEAASMRAQSEKIMVPLVSMKSKIPTLPEEKRDMIEKLPNNAESLAATAESLDQEIEGDKTLMEERANSTVRVRKTLFAEVRVDIRGDRHRFTQVFGGPLLIERVGTRIRAKSQG